MEILNSSTSALAWGNSKTSLADNTAISKTDMDNDSAACSRTQYHCFSNVDIP